METHVKDFEPKVLESLNMNSILKSLLDQTQVITEKLSALEIKQTTMALNMENLSINMNNVKDTMEKYVQNPETGVVTTLGHHAKILKQIEQEKIIDKVKANEAVISNIKKVVWLIIGTLVPIVTALAIKVMTE